MLSQSARPADPWRPGPARCFICGNSLARIFALGDWEDLHCPDCGDCRLSRALLNLMMLQGRTFDVVRTQGWIAHRRLCDPIPTILLGNAIFPRPAS